MEASNAVLFYGLDDFSNFHPAPISIDGRIYPTVEHYYHTQKFIAHPAIYEAIVAAPSPQAAKDLSRLHVGHVRPDWNLVKEQVMKAGCAAKFSQHERLRRALLETGNRELIEDTPHDAYWGRIPDGSGQNRLGVILMCLREELRKAERL